jgi:UDP-N-acetylmuramoyl-tripeptide--D-alanyl-D-alanine ligase
VRIDLPDPQGFTDLFAEVTGQSVPAPITGIATDSRECQPGDLFIALEGAQVDGHAFLADVANQGAGAALVRHPDPALTRLVQITVSDPRETIGQIARLWREQVTLPVIAITGSNGKTSTKELLRIFFSPSETVHATTGNYNTSIGLPLTLLQITEAHTLSILELGANQPGDIAYLCRLAQPTHGLITNIAPAHLEGFGTVEAIAREKGELFRAVSEGTAFVNLSDEWIRSLPRYGQEVTYGTTPECDFPADIHRETDGTYTLTIDTVEIATRSANITLARNVIAAAAVAVTFGVDWDVIQNQVTTYSPPPGRCRILQHKNFTIIDDSYNANLQSTIAAIDLLTSLQGNGRRVLVFGDMLELGSQSAELHRKVGEKCSQARLDAVYTVGSDSIHTDEVLENIPSHHHFATKSDLIDVLRRELQRRDKILVKGSRGMAMETVIQALLES